VKSRIVLIGLADSLPALQERLDQAADIHTFTDSEALDALDHIMEAKPAVVALQDVFSESSRGVALINRIKDDPTLTETEVRIIAKDSKRNRVAVKRGHGGGAAVAVEDGKPSLDQKGTRRAPRVKVKDGVEITIDGNPASLVDVSTVGVQVVSPTILKPNQRVRVVLGEAKHQIKCSGSIAWAAFEMPKGLPTRYRAGIDFGTAADVAGINAFSKKHKKAS
jgi:hypothetical protein